VSVLLTPLPDDRRLLAAATGLAVADAVAGLGLVPRIKWPNDILCANRKVAGCLVDLAQDPAGNPLAIAGIGINANVPADAFPETAGPQPVSLHTLTGGSVDRESLLASLLLHLHRWVEAARAGDVDLFRTRWREQDALIGARVVARVGNQRIAGRVLSTDPVDGLHLEDDAGIHHALRAEHSHLDAVDLADVPLPPGGRKSRE
jgi:BirA family biotin operon repressor/biotin-[acetyl-CoA-carboxylase] ligase